MVRGFSSKYIVLAGIGFLFFLANFIIYHLKVGNELVILAPTGIYFIVSLQAFCLLMVSRRALDPLPWYLLGTGIFFGFGFFAACIDHSSTFHRFFPNDFRLIAYISLLNSLSIFIVLVFSTLLRELLLYKFIKGRINGDTRIIQGRIYLYLLLIGVVDVILRFAYFPMPTDLIVRSFLDKLNYVLPAILIYSAWHYDSLSKVEKILSLFLFISQIFIGLLFLNKYELLTPVLSVTIGFWLRGVSYKKIVLTVVVIASFLMFLNPMLTIGRMHNTFRPSENSLVDRLLIIGDTTLVSLDINGLEMEAKGPTANNDYAKERLTMRSRFMAFISRFDVATVQGFLIEQYRNEKPGKSLDDFWIAIIPRALWHEKPIITSQGNDLSVIMFSNPEQRTTSTAPTYLAEAYWNGGIPYLIVVSIYLGLLLGVFSALSEVATSGSSLKYPPYLLIAYPAVVMAAFIESWIVPTYIGGAITLFSIYLLVRLSICLFERISNHNHSDVRC